MQKQNNQSTSEFYLGTADEYMETTSFNTTGQLTWPAAMKLFDFLCSTTKKEDVFGKKKKKKNIIELGSGNGWLAMQLLTNYDEDIYYIATEMENGGALDWLERIIEENVRRNLFRNDVKIKCKALDWNAVDEFDLGVLRENDDDEDKDDRNEKKKKKFDLILGSDLVYEESGVKLLPKVIKRLLREKCEKEAYMLYSHTKHRYDAMDCDFLENLEVEGLECVEVRIRDEELPPSPPPFSSLFPEQRIAIYRISLFANEEEEEEQIEDRYTSRYRN